jgi:hypothetical protein
MADRPTREYMILQQHTPPGMSGPTAWRELGLAEGATDDVAIRSLVDHFEPNNRAGTFTAVPARYWHPRTRIIETVTVDRWQVDDKGPVPVDEPDEAVPAHTGASAHGN